MEVRNLVVGDFGPSWLRGFVLVKPPTAGTLSLLGAAALWPPVLAPNTASAPAIGGGVFLRVNTSKGAKF